MSKEIEIIQVFPIDEDNSRLMDTLLQIIPTGKENALHQEEIANRLGISRARVKALIRAARDKGIEILSGIHGYYYAKDDNEREEFAATISKQAYTRLKTAKPIKCALKNVSGQISLSDALNNVSEEV